MKALKIIYIEILKNSQRATCEKTMGEAYKITTGEKTIFVSSTFVINLEDEDE
jgi:hypothetical protein